MIDFSEVKLFKTSNGRSVTYEDLLRDVYEHSEETRDSIKTLVGQMSSLIKSPSDAVMLMAHVTVMIESRVKNDDLLVKVASILSRLIQKNLDKNDGPDWELSEEDRRQLLQEAESLLDKRV